MAPTSKKRHKAPRSDASKSPDSDIQSTKHPLQAKTSSNPIVMDDSNDEVPSTDVAQSQGLTDEQELSKSSHST
ncbi:hypothetical protein PtB15_11B682 [Puccinia triticina]|nr:hypothetical protein PtB15_11B682 [Puccinia triticina]